MNYKISIPYQKDDLNEGSWLKVILYLSSYKIVKVRIVKSFHIDKNKVGYFYASKIGTI